MCVVLADQALPSVGSGSLGLQPPTPTGLREKIASQLGNSLVGCAQELAGQTALDPVELGRSIEGELYWLLGSAGKEYREKFRSLHFNLNDPKNPDLRTQVLTGKIPPRDLVRMSAHELASSELNKW